MMYATYPDRRAPFNVRKQREEQLWRGVKQKVIEYLKGPTPWVSCIVAAPKPKSPHNIEYCTNRVIVEMTGNLNADVFTKLDLDQKWNQLLLDLEASYITPVSSHIILMRY